MEINRFLMPLALGRATQLGVGAQHVIAVGNY